MIGSSALAAAYAAFSHDSRQVVLLIGSNENFPESYDILFYVKHEAFILYTELEASFKKKDSVI